MTETQPIKPSSDTKKVLSNLEIVQAFSDALQSIPPSERNPFEFAKLLSETIGNTNTVILNYDKENATLEYETQYPKVVGAPPTIYVNTFNVDAKSLTAKLASGQQLSYTTPPDDDRLSSLIAVIQANHVTLVPLKSGEGLGGLVAFYNTPDSPLSDTMLQIINVLRPNLSFILEMLLQQKKIQTRIQDVERESDIFSRIDAELNDTIEINHVFTMMKDWALRFTNADAAALALFNIDTEALRIMSQYAFKDGALKIGEEIPREQAGIMLRVARSGNSEIVANVTTDNDYYALADGMHTQMSVPIKREEKVIGVLTLLSKKLYGFSDDHLDFAKRLSSRAGVAVDNARLFTETKREREKLSNILRNISENVILVGLDHRIEMINSSAILAFHLGIDDIFIGKNFTDVFTHSQLQMVYQDAVEGDDTVSAELTLPNGRAYHASIEYHSGIGRIIVMQDITYFKETDRLKTELIATVSHDLKQPLSVMRGYLDLLNMVNKFDEKSLKYVDHLNFAFNSMRQLIDDLLDIARIESGLSLELEDVSIKDILNRAVRNSQQQADSKSIKLELDLPDTLPLISGEPKRLEQIFTNIVSNAVKYTPPEGKVELYIEVKQAVLRIFVKDNGLGISAEDQAKIFERFYRIRRPETESIEGTGLGLAIVKSLVEAHEGKVDLKSVAGKGSTFRVTLPLP